MVFIIVFSSSCSSDTKEKKQQSRAVPVTTEKVKVMDMPVILNAVGNVQAYASVSIKSQVNGQLMDIHFKEGQYVKKGDLLFTIDPRPFQNSVRQSEATLLKITAQYEQAKRDIERYNALLNEGFVTQAQYDQMATNLKVLESAIDGERANLENARLQLSYCYIYAPLTGKIGSLFFDRGNLIKASDDKAMAVINQINPIYVRFSLPEQYLSELRQAGRIEVIAITSNKEQLKGILTFIDNSVDKSTGTINVRGDFENKDEKVLPGQFVNVALNLKTIKSAIVVPTEAIQSGQRGEYVYRLKDDMTVEMVTVVSGHSKDGWTVIKSGDLKTDYKVITEGHLRIRPGIKVQEQQKEQKSKGNTH